MKAWLQLGLGIGCLLMVWLILLPRLAKWPPIGEHCQRMEQAGIQVDAMFYSELNSVPGL